MMPRGIRVNRGRRDAGGGGDHPDPEIPQSGQKQRSWGQGGSEEGLREKHEGGRRYQHPSGFQASVKAPFSSPHKGSVIQSRGGGHDCASHQPSSAPSLLADGTDGEGRKGLCKVGRAQGMTAECVQKYSVVKKIFLFLLFSKCTYKSSQLLHTLGAE